MTMPRASRINVTCTPPHDIPGEKVNHFLPSGPGVERVLAVMAEAERILADHDVNVVRRELGENPATGIWLWGQGKAASLQPFARRFGVSGAVIAAVDLIRGIGSAAGLELIDVPGATGYLDTNYQGKGQAGVNALDRLDLVIVHIEAPDEAGHNGDLRGKVGAIEAIDEHIVGPILGRLGKENEWRMLVAPDHPTPVGLRTHTRTPPPFCLAGAGIPADESSELTEVCAAKAGWLIDPGHELMEFVLRP
jgi:2,3-bisphosphoglycerate-independent phosphoglycerate mutase